MADLKKKQIPLRLSSKLYAAIASWQKMILDQSMDKSNTY